MDKTTRAKEREKQKKKTSGKLSSSFNIYNLIHFHRRENLCCTSVVRCGSLAPPPPPSLSQLSTLIAELVFLAVYNIRRLQIDFFSFLLLLFGVFLLCFSRLTVLNSQPRLFIYFISLPTSSFLGFFTPSLHPLQQHLASASACFLLLFALPTFLSSRKRRKFHDFIVDEFFERERDSTLIHDTTCLLSHSDER